MRTINIMNFQIKKKSKEKFKLNLVNSHIK